MEGLERRRLQFDFLRSANWEVTAQCLAALFQVLDLGAVVGRANERNGLDDFLRQLQIKTLRNVEELFFIELFLLVGDVLPFTRFTKAVTFHGHGKDYRGLAFVLRRALERVVDLYRVVTTAPQTRDLLVGLVFYKFEQLGIFPEEFLSAVCAAASFEILVLAVNALSHTLDQEAAGVAVKQLVPVSSPKHFDDIPAGSAKNAFELLNDAGIAADGPIKPLQVAVDDKDEIVELFARRRRAGLR